MYFQLVGNVNSVESRKCRSTPLTPEAAQGRVTVRVIDSDRSLRIRNSFVVVWIDSQFLHTRDQGGSAEAHTHCGAVRTPYASLAFSQNPNDLIVLLHRALSWLRLVLERGDRLLDDTCN